MPQSLTECSLGKLWRHFHRQSKSKIKDEGNLFYREANSYRQKKSAIRQLMFIMVLEDPKFQNIIIPQLSWKHISNSSKNLS